MREESYVGADAAKCDPSVACSDAKSKLQKPQKYSHNLT